MKSQLRRDRAIRSHVQRACVRRERRASRSIIDEYLIAHEEDMAAQWAEERRFIEDCRTDILMLELDEIDDDPFFDMLDEDCGDDPRYNSSMPDYRYDHFYDL